MEKPIIFNQKIQVKDIAEKYQINQTFDTYKEQLEDLFLIRNPQYKFDKNYQTVFAKFLEKHTSGKSLQDCGKWIYFPWNKILIHYLDDELHQEIRTARNKNLITKEEQTKFYNLKVGIAGLSVGSHGAISTALMGGSKVMKLADPDVISASNLNRMRFDFTMIGKHKGEAIAEYLYQLDPYADITLYKEGVTERNINQFLDNIDVLVEELDDLSIKIRLREEARKRRIPVIMATDSSDNVILDVERFDLHPDIPIFHGALEGMDLSNLKTDRAKLFEAMGRIIDLRLVTERQLDTIKEIGKTIYSWPQLATAATASGALLAYTIRRIALGQPLVEGKHKLNLDALLDADYKKTMSEQRRALVRFMHAMDAPPISMWDGIIMQWKKMFLRK